MRTVLRLTVVMVLLAGGAASAKGDDHAKQLYNQGEAAFMSGNYADAATLFEKAYAESKKPALLWNVAQAQRRQYDIDKDINRLRRARLVYENFAAASPDDKSKEDAAREEAALDAMLKEIEAGKEVKAAAREEAPVTFEAMPDLEPAKPAIVVAPVIPPPPPPPPSRTWIYVTVAVVAVVAVGVGVGVALSSSKDPPAPSLAGGLYQAAF